MRRDKQQGSGFPEVRVPELTSLPPQEPDPETDARPMDELLRELADIPLTRGGTLAPFAVEAADADEYYAEQLGIPKWADELHRWWVQTANHDIESSIGKIVQYGGRGAAYDLIATGHDLAAMNGRRGQLSDQEAIELAICFYLSSKVNRWMAAVIDGRQPSDDTILDIVYYGMMARRNRAAGGWPIKAGD